MDTAWRRTEGFRRAGYVDGAFAAAFLALFAVLLWPALLGGNGLWWPIPLASLVVVAFAPVGRPGFWMGLRNTVFAASALILVGAAAWHGLGGRLDRFTQPAFVVLCLLLALRSRTRRDRG